MDKISKRIYDSIVNERDYYKNKKAYLLGGQPGCGKSSFIRNNKNQSDLQHAVSINGDDYRVFHPNYKKIASDDITCMPNLTQPFVNDMVEAMIDTFSSEHYNLIIEGTLRTSNVPETTCRKLKKQGYETNLVVIACDVSESWKSTLLRAENMAKNGEYPRFVPIENYNNTISNIANNMDYLHSANCFDHMTITTRNGEILYTEKDFCKPSEILNQTLNIKNWKQNYDLYSLEFNNEQKKIIELYNDKKEQFSPSPHLQSDIQIQPTYTSAYQHTLDEFADLGLIDDDTADFDYDFELE